MLGPSGLSSIPIHIFIRRATPYRVGLHINQDVIFIEPTFNGSDVRAYDCVGYDVGYDVDRYTESTYVLGVGNRRFMSSYQTPGLGYIHDVG